MKCQDVQLWIMEPDNDKRNEAEAHVAVCVECERFAQDYGQLSFVSNLQAPPLSLIVKNTVYTAAYKCIEKSSYRMTMAAIPAKIWAVLISVILLSSIWIFFTAANCIEKGQVTTAGMFAICWFLQNCIMLIFMPAVVRQFRRLRHFQPSVNWQKQQLVAMDLATHNG
ncbi:hypothetical protein KAR48_08975 [bacterium]|nr:hypothetical protein [bacterium]